MGFSVILLISVIIRVFLVNRTQGAAHFTVVPPSTLYVSVGETAKLVWDYTVDNRTGEFDMFSPRWNFYADNGSAFLIAQESIINNWEWSIQPATCPARLLNPVRVSKESNATLLIHNVTLADSGTYGCSLILATRSPMTSKVNLVVTSYPIITLNLSSSSMIANASRTFFIICSAAGTPTPNVTWQTVGGKVIDQGVGKALINITNATLDDSEIYQCCATNNPNKPEVCKITLISAQHKPESDLNKTCTSHNRSKIILRCNESGVSFSSNGKIFKALHNVTAGSVLELVITNEDRYGMYKCKTEEYEEFNELCINTQTAPTSKPNNTTPISPTIVVFSTLKVHQVPTSKSIEASPTSTTSTAVGRNQVDKNFILLAAGGAVSFVLLMTIVILAVTIFKKRSKNKDAEAQQRENELPSLQLDAEENALPLYATVDLSKKKRNRLQEDIPIYAQVDKSKKKRPNETIYAELDHMHLTGVIPPPLPKRNAYDENDDTQNGSQTKNAESIYASIQLE